SWHRILQGVIEGQNLPGYLGPYCPEVITVLDVTVGFEQVTDRQVGGGLAVGHGTALQPQPTLRVVGRAAPRADTVAPVQELVDQARLAHPGFPDEGDHLPLAGPGAGQSLL